MKFILKIYGYLLDKLAFIHDVLRIFTFTHGKLIAKQYKNGEKVFILGNGPSLKNVLENYTEELSQNNLFCVNGMATTPEYTVLKPKYYIFVDPVLTGLREYDVLSEDERIIRKKFIDSFVNKTEWDIVLFLPFSSQYKKWLMDELQKNEHIKPHFMKSVPSFREEEYIYDLMAKGYVAPQFQNVLIPAIYVSLIMGYKNIYLLGADHDWIKDWVVDENNNVIKSDKHFYKDSICEKKSKIDGQLEGLHYHDMLMSGYRAFWGYHRLQRLAKKMDADIYNCTQGSFIDAFERKNIADVI